jgi:biopolymer transport protein ExbD
MCVINTTPMIDVMLVLLVMMILSLPMRTHKVGIELPTGASGGTPPVTHHLTLDRFGTAAWDGIIVSGAGLNDKLAAHAADPAQPVLVMQVDAATSYDRFDHVIAAVKQAGVDRLGFAGNDAFRRF